MNLLANPDIMSIIPHPIAVFVEFNFDSDEDFIDYVNGFREYSTFKSDVELQPRDRFVSLCTCSYEWENARYMLIGRLVPIMEEVPA